MSCITNWNVFQECRAETPGENRLASRLLFCRRFLRDYCADHVRSSEIYVTGRKAQVYQAYRMGLSRCKLSRERIRPHVSHGDNEFSAERTKRRR